MLEKILAKKLQTNDVNTISNWIDNNQSEVNKIISIFKLSYEQELEIINGLKASKLANELKNKRLLVIAINNLLIDYKDILTLCQTSEQFLFMVDNDISLSTDVIEINKKGDFFAIKNKVTNEDLTDFYFAEKNQVKSVKSSGNKTTSSDVEILPINDQAVLISNVPCADGYSAKIKIGNCYYRAKSKFVSDNGIIEGVPFNLNGYYNSKTKRIVNNDTTKSIVSMI